MRPNCFEERQLNIQSQFSPFTDTKVREVFTRDWCQAFLGKKGEIQ